MSFCPKCRSEFEEGVKICAECDEGLVTDLPAETKWENIYTCGVENEAYLIKGYLENSGIPCVIESKKFNAEPVNFGAMSEIELHVPLDRSKEAVRLIKEKNMA